MIVLVGSEAFCAGVSVASLMTLLRAVETLETKLGAEDATLVAIVDCVALDICELAKLILSPCPVSRLELSIRRDIAFGTVDGGALLDLREAVDETLRGGLGGFSSGFALAFISNLLSARS